jgi:simple sugar transport system substrate-binding protein
MRGRLLLFSFCLLAAPFPAAGACERETRIGVVLHGPPNDPFWQVVLRGMHDAAAASGAALDFPSDPLAGRGEAPFKEAIVDRLAAGATALIISVPSLGAVEEGLEKAHRAGTPFITINSGGHLATQLGALLHVGQGEMEAGYRVGQRLANGGFRSALCLIHEPENQSLLERCRGLAQGLGGVVRTVELANPGRRRQTLARAIATDPPEAIVALGPATARDAIAARGKAKLVVFDLGPEVLDAVEKGEVEFAVDQQPYLQGYLPVMLLRQHTCSGAMPTADIATGPALIDAAAIPGLRALVSEGFR